MPIKLIVNLPDETVDDLKRLAKRQGTTITQALKEAIATEAYLVRKLDQGHRVLIENQNGQIREVVFR